MTLNVSIKASHDIMKAPELCFAMSEGLLMTIAVISRHCAIKATIYFMPAS